MRQLDVEADRERAPGKSPLIGSLHQPGAAAGDHGKAGVREQPRQFHRALVPLMSGLDASTAENRDCRFDRTQLFGGVDELGHNLKRPPGLLTWRQIERARATGLPCCLDFGARLIRFLMGSHVAIS
jgi:hypothetical protein